MSAEVLRRAAALMRERAEAAAPGPWSSVEIPGLDGDVAFAGGCVAASTPTSAPHIASWHPAVALAVADWLEVVASRYAAMLDTFAPGSLAGARTAAANVDGWKQALAVANAYLGTADV